ncbi:MAG: hypothetical protein WD431_02225 [Cyclobacteriaceae bacterium]
MLSQNYQLIFLVLILLLTGCHAPQKQAQDPKSKKEAKDDKLNTAIKNSISKKELFYHSSDNGSQTKKQITKNGYLLYESLSAKGKVTQNHFYPEILDAFLFEDKYYLKLKFPLPFKGKISFTLPENPDYVKTRLEPNYYQLVINDALDLDQVKLRLKYEPAEGDSLIREEYNYTHVVFE